jgi:hypothetical protein
MKFVVIGFIKCGQSSLIEYLRREHDLPVIDSNGDPLVRRNECIWQHDGVKTMEKLDKQGFKCVIILRDAVERIWSSYYYFGHYRKMTYEKYLALEGSNSHGEENPIKQSNYNYWINKFEKFDPLIFHLEDISSKMDKINITKDPNYRPIPTPLRELTQALLNKTFK